MVVASDYLSVLIPLLIIVAHNGPLVSSDEEIGSSGVGTRGHVLPAAATHARTALGLLRS